MLTNKFLYTLNKDQFNYNIHRKVPIKFIDAITTSKDVKNPEVLVHFSNDYDERYNAKEHRVNIKYVLFKLLTAANVQFKIFDVPEKKLSNYATTKKDHEKKKYKRPAGVHLNPSFTPSKLFTLIQGSTTEPMYEKECVEDLQQMMADAKVATLPTDVPGEDTKEEIKSHIEKLTLQIE